MSSWEYKLISSGPLGFASMQLLEQHLGQLGKDEWEIINFTTKPDNPLVFHGLARRPVARDWFPPAEKKPAYTPPPIPEEEDDGKDERSFADDLPPARPANAPAPADLGLGSFDDLGGSEEDLPTLFEALQPFLRKNPRGDLSVGLDFLAKKFEQAERELLAAFEECGLKTPAPGGEKGDVVDHDGSLYWLERDNKGRVWLNTRDKKFKTARTTPVAAEEVLERSSESIGGGALRPEVSRPRAAPVAEASAPADTGSFLGRIRSMMRRNRRGHGWSGSFQYLTKALKLDESQLLEKLGEFGLRLEGGDTPVLAEDGGFDFWLNKNHRGEIWINAEEKKAGAGSKERGAGSRELGGGEPADRRPAPAARTSEPRRDRPERAVESAPADPGSFLGRIRAMMRRNRRGHGWSGSFQYLTKALKLDETQLLEKLGEFGLRLAGGDTPVLAVDGDFEFWLNKNHRGEIWINAEEKKLGSVERGSSFAKASEDRAGEAKGEQGGGGTDREYVDPREPAVEKRPLPPENTLTAVRLMMQPKKRGEGVTALVAELAAKLEKSDEQLLALLASAGLELPESPKAKPTFAEHGGEIYWLNVNAKGQVWVNAKQTAAKKSRAKKSAD